MSFTLQAGVVLDRPPIVIERASEGGPARSTARAIGGQLISQEMSLVQTKSRLVVFLTAMTDAQRVALETALDTVGPRVVYTGSESPACVPGARAEHVFTELVLPEGYEDVDVNGQPLPASLRLWNARITYYRLS